LGAVKSSLSTRTRAISTPGQILAKMDAPQDTE
jgi:hypothetical protein